MINAYDIVYGLGVGVSSPFWLAKPSARRKVFRAFRERMGTVAARDAADSTHAIMIHAVSLGEMNATRALIDQLRLQHPAIRFIVSTTTTTGYERGAQLYGSHADVSLIRYPLDFTRAVKRTLNAMRPSVIVLMELELWPNFLRICWRRKIPIVLANGRLTSSSFKRYKMISPITAAMVRRVSRVCVQDETYARRFIELGAAEERVRVTGTMKFDTAQIAERVDGDSDLAAAVGLLRGGAPIWVCGSTGPGEEELILREYRNLLAQFGRLRLVIVPRKPERFDEVSDLIESFRFKVVRRSRGDWPEPNAPVPAVVLGDTMGELRKFYSLADVVFVGRSLVDLGPRQHGSDMIEPAALGKPIIVGPHTENFADAVDRFRKADALLEVDDAESMMQAVKVMLSTPAEARAMGQRAQQVVRQEQGATRRHAEVIGELLGQLVEH